MSVNQTEIECVEEETTFVTVVDCVFVGDPDALTDAERNMTVRGFETVYNDLQAESVCDSLQRLVLNVSAPIIRQVDDSVANSSKGEFVLSYEITGSCRGCPEPVLFEDSINRNQSPARLLEFDAYNRSLVTTCTCPAGVEERGLEQQDFIDAYQEWIIRKSALGELENLTGLESLSETGTFHIAAVDASNDGNSAFDGKVPMPRMMYCLCLSWFVRKVLN